MKLILEIVNSAATFPFLSQISVIFAHKYVDKSSIAIMALLLHISVPDPVAFG
jgi:hypothetical protein